METEQLVQSKYDITSHKLQQKKKSLFLTHGSVLYNISKIAQNRSGGKYRKITLKGDKWVNLPLQKMTIKSNIFISLFCSDMRFGLNRPRRFRILNPFFPIRFRF